MKKFCIFALVLVMIAGLLAACTGTGETETTQATTATQSTTRPTTAPTTAPTTTPTTNPTETTGGVNTMDPTTGNARGRMNPRMPWEQMPGRG